jgi:hypothetical protein
MQKQKGVGLVELMISGLLASLLIAVLVQQYLSVKQQYSHLQGLLEQDLELQMINDLLRNSVRRAGFTPCAGLSSLKSFDLRNGRTGLAAIGRKASKANSLELNRMSEYFTLAKFIGQNQLWLASDLQFEAQQVLLIADCYHAEVQQVLSAKKTSKGTILTLSHNRVFDYVDPIYLGEWIEESFFIQKDQQGVSALFYHQKQNEELSKHIKSMSVELKNYQAKTFVKLIWGLEKAKTVTLETEVRAE